MRTSTAVFICLLGILAMALVSESQANGVTDLEMVDRQYCSYVKSGDWPDYNGNYATLCDVK